MSIPGLETRSGLIIDGTAAEHFREAVPVNAFYADVIDSRVLASKENLEADLRDTKFNQLKFLCKVFWIDLD